MGGITTTLFQRPRDPQFNNTTLLLSGNFPTNGAQNNTFLDSSSNNFSITRNGNTTQGTFSPFSQTGWSNYFGGGADFFNLPSSSTVFSSIGTGAFTIEGWVYATKSGSGVAQGFISTAPVGTTGNGAYLYLTAADKLGFSIGNGAAGVDLLASTTFPFNQWVYIAGTRAASTGAAALYINGVQVVTSTATTNLNIGDCIVGRSYTNANQNYFQGYLSNFRISNTVRTITTPTAAFTNDANTLFLVSQSNRFVDNSSNNLALNIGGTPSVQAFSPFVPSGAYTTTAVGGSGYFDGSGDYLTLADSTAWDLTGDYTIEMWVYPITTANSLIGIGSYISPNNGLTLYYNTNKLELYVNGAAVLTGGSTIVKNQWNHIAVVRSGSSTNNTKLYLNGAQDGQGTNTTSFTGVAGNGVSINNDYANSYSANTGSCYMSGLRILNGVAQYTAAFTPPTAPPTAITNTSLLCNFTNAGIVDSTAKNVLETVGNAQISTAVSRFGGSSMSFDGSSDWLTTPITQNTIIPASSSFTIEGWFRFNSAPTSFLMILSDSGGGSSKYFTINGSRIDAQFGASAGTTAYCSYTFSANTWYHIALVRNGTTVNIYVDGVSQAMTQGTQSGSFLDQGSLLYVGRFGGSPSYEFNGYIDDLRITRGVARYTANFNVPTIGFTDR